MKQQYNPQTGEITITMDWLDLEGMVGRGEAIYHTPGASEIYVATEGRYTRDSAIYTVDDIWSAKIQDGTFDLRYWAGPARGAQDWASYVATLSARSGGAYQGDIDEARHGVAVAVTEALEAQGGPLTESAADGLRQWLAAGEWDGDETLEGIVAEWLRD